VYRNKTKIEKYALSKRNDRALFIDSIQLELLSYRSLFVERPDKNRAGVQL